MEFRPLLRGDFRESVRTNEITSKKLWRAAFAELVGTLLFVHIECGAILATNNNVLSVAIAVSFAIVALNYCLVDISGAYFNPAVTLAAALVREISPLKAILYIIHQMVGAVMGVLILYALLPSTLVETTHFHIITTHLTSITRAQGVFMEAVITFGLVFVYLMIDINPYKRSIKKFAPMVIGSILTAIVIFAYPFTGASANPARSFGSAAIVNYWDDHWVYWIGPLIGSLLATLFFKIFETHWHELEREGEMRKDIDVAVAVVPSAE